MKENKTDKNFWEKTWGKSQLERYYGIERYQAINKRLDGLFKRFLEKGDKKILEIGCAGAKQLIYFAREFGYEVCGIDYSEKGAAIARENLAIAGVKAAILCEDIFKTSLADESFDVVYSMGLVEHFENPAEIIGKHIRLLKSGGKLIITVPNFRDSLYLALRKMMGSDKSLLATHNLDIMDKKYLAGILSGQGIKILYLDYFGPVNLAMVVGEIKSRPLLYLMHLINQLIGYLTFFMPASRYFSPYIVLIGTKTADSVNT
jgi:2-polyprenyl-3-methyl-5-hydroxy-6-metoxy-1,4-benzoquinol methylase